MSFWRCATLHCVHHVALWFPLARPCRHRCCNENGQSPLMVVSSACGFVAGFHPGAPIGLCGPRDTVVRRHRVIERFGELDCARLVVAATGVLRFMSNLRTSTKLRARRRFRDQSTPRQRGRRLNSRRALRHTALVAARPLNTKRDLRFPHRFFKARTAGASAQASSELVSKRPAPIFAHHNAPATVVRIAPIQPQNIIT